MIEYLDTDVVEAQCLADYQALVGKVVLAHRIECLDDDDVSDTVHLSPPAVIRILPTNSIPDEIHRWMDDWNCDPIYNVEVLEAHKALGGSVRPNFVFGLSRATDGSTSDADFELAPSDMQTRYADVAPQKGDETSDVPSLRY